MPANSKLQAYPSTKLRKQAEAVASAAHLEVAALSPEETRRLIHELEVHQIELQIQNQELTNAQIELAESRDRLATLYDHAPVGYITLESDTTIHEANLTSAELLGVPRSELIGRKFTGFVNPESQDDLYHHQRTLQASARKQTCELLLHHANGSTFHALLTCMPEAGETRSRCVIQDITARKKAEDALRDLTAELEGRVNERTAELNDAYSQLKTDCVERENLERRIETIAEAERHRIGLDLHDGLSQVLTGLRFKASALASQASGRDPKITEEARFIADRLGDALDQARAISRGLQPVQSDPEGLMAALEELAATTSRFYQIDCRFTIHGPGLVTDPQVATHLYRIAQEAVTNAVKHAKPRSIRIALRDHENCLALSIVNDGGAPERLSSAGGVGIKSMEFRAQRMTARLECRAHRSGTLVRCILPRSPHQSVTA